MKALLLVALVSACGPKKPPAKPEQQQGSAAPVVSDPDVDARGADEGRAGTVQAPTPLPPSQPAN